jgi:NAD(P)H-dependent flavin oxidoreductase YrpB (nitropropane dioxygenase family)
VSDQTYSLPVVIQGGMGIAVSSWQLAKAVSQTGQLGVVSGTAIDSVFARRLQNGDPTGDLRRAIANFPFPEVGRRVRDRYFRPEGRKSGHQYMAAPKLTLKPSSEALELLVLSNFAEVWLAKEGHAGLVGINYLEKIQMATPSSAYGAMLAGVDYVLMGAGIPAEIPQLLNNLAQHEAASLNVQVDGSTISYKTTFYPKTFSHHELPALHRPNFLAIISAHVLATYLARDEVTRPDGFIIEGAVAGGHNAPPRGHMVLDENGEPIFGPRDEPDIGKVAKIGLPFWLAGGYSSPADVSRAISMGAAGVQVGTLFSLAHETGLTAKLRAELMAHLNAGDLIVRTDPYASPTGFPFKVVILPDTLSQSDLYAERPRLCDLGYLRVPYERSPGTVGYRCSAEPTHVFLRKGGSEADALGRKCLCNGLMANIGLEQTRGTGYTELPLLTLGADLSGVLEMLKDYPDGWSAEEAVRYLLKVSVEQGSMPLAAVPVLERRV